MSGARGLIRARAARAGAWAALLGFGLTLAAALLLGRRLHFALRFVLAALVALGRPVLRRARAPARLTMGVILAVLQAWLWLSYDLLAPCGAGQCLQPRALRLLLAAAALGFAAAASSHQRPRPPLLPQAALVRARRAVATLLPRAFRAAPVPIILSALLCWQLGPSLRTLLLTITPFQYEEPSLDGLLDVLSPNFLLPLAIQCILFYIHEYVIISMFDVFMTERIIFPIEQTAEWTPLHQELIGEDETLNRAASNDLLHLACRDEVRRNQIFTLSLPGGHPTNWNNVSKACLKIINDHTAQINGVAEENKNENMSRLPPKSPPPDRVIRSTLRNLSSPLNIQTRSDEKIPAKGFKDFVRFKIGLMIKNIRNKPFVKYFLGDISEAKLREAARHGSMVAETTRGLAEIVAASLEEDRYGVVQNDLPIVMTAMIRLKLSVDRLSKSNIINAKNLKRDPTVNQYLAEIKSAVKRSIYKITITFGEHMKSFQLIDETRMALMPFVNMCES